MIRINLRDTELFDRQAVVKTFGLRESTLRREVREGRLRVFVRAGKQWYRGADLRAWIETGAVAETEEQPEG